MWSWSYSTWHNETPMLVLYLPLQALAFKVHSLITNAVGSPMSYFTDRVNWDWTLTKPLLLSEWYLTKWILGLDEFGNHSLKKKKTKQNFNDWRLVMSYGSEEEKPCVLLFYFLLKMILLKLITFQSLNELYFLSFICFVLYLGIFEFCSIFLLLHETFSSTFDYNIFIVPWEIILSVAFFY